MSGMSFGAAVSKNPVKTRDRHLAGYDEKTGKKLQPEPDNNALSDEGPTLRASAFLHSSPLQSIPHIKPHLLTCEMRSIRIRPDIAPTRFKPPLFLKSGPMLRYCGMRR